MFRSTAFRVFRPLPRHIAVTLTVTLTLTDTVALTLTYSHPYSCLLLLLSRDKPGHVEKEVCQVLHENLAFTAPVKVQPKHIKALHKRAV